MPLVTPSRRGLLSPMRDSPDPPRQAIVSLDAPDAEDSALVGGKAARLAMLLRAGFRVPPGVCLTTAGYRQVVGVAEAGPAAASSGSTAVAGLPTLPPELALDLARAVAALDGRPEARFAVRSSAVLEDAGDASFAGQLHSYLNVSGSDVPSAVLKCWSALLSERAAHNRRTAGRTVDHGIAALVQVMVPTAAAGVAFSVDPTSGAAEIVVEAARGLGERLTQSRAHPDRYHLDRASLAEIHRPMLGRARSRVLGAAELRMVGGLVMAVERQLGGPQDVEWGLAHGDLFVLQARPVDGHPVDGHPVTGQPAGSIFTDVLPGDDILWTSGFLEERFPEPLSPLGWSSIRSGFEEYAIRDPLRYLGAEDLGPLPPTKLFRGHPYVKVEVFRRLYRLFPEPLLPEDAWRYFPNGETDIRRQVSVPLSPLDPRLWGHLIASWAQDPGNWSPLRNHVIWEEFVPRYDRAVARVEAELAARPGLEALLEHVATLEQASGELLRIHRWSLTHADLLYTLLRRIGRRWLGQAAETICSDLVAHLSDHSLEMDARLRALAGEARRTPAIVAALRGSRTLDDLVCLLEDVPLGPSFLADLRAFLASYGHRSLSLDLIRPSFAADPSQVFRLLVSLLDAGPPREQAVRRERAFRAMRRRLFASPLGPFRWSVFEQVITLAQTYVRLREDQRFHWQKSIAALREAYLQIGERLVELGALETADDVFFLAKAEVEATARRALDPAEAKRLVPRRRQEYAELAAEHERSPNDSYPRFLRGRRPLAASDPPGRRRLTGQPVSPGRAQGRVRVIRTLDELVDLKAGEILVTRGADPGWTPLFGKIAGLVMEGGGQLSHGSVVAREYGLPAVVGVIDATAALRDGDLVLVDGEAGTVDLLDGADPG